MKNKNKNYYVIFTIIVIIILLFFLYGMKNKERFRTTTTTPKGGIKSTNTTPKDICQFTRFEVAVDSVLEHCNNVVNVGNQCIKDNNCLLFNEGHYKCNITAGNKLGLCESTGKSSSKGCFSKDSLLKLENGNTIKIEDAKIGDKILSYSLLKNKLNYSPIVAIPHERNNKLTKFIKFTTNSSKSIKMTEKHLIPALQKNNNSFNIILAEKIKINDIIKTIDGNEQITSIETVEEEGIYTVVTLEEYIVVDNIIASPYELYHILANIYYSLHKNLYRLNPEILNSPYFKKFNEECINFYNKLSI